MAWLRFFLGGVRETAIEAVARAGRLMALRERWLNKLRDSAKALILLDELFLNPFVTVARAQELLKVSNPTARQLVGRLQQDGLLAEVTGRDWGRLYVARPILRAIERADPAARKSGNRP
jgi:Fic family protein